MKQRTKKKAANDFGRTGAEDPLGPFIREMRRRGCSIRGMAIELTKRKVQTPRGGAWHPQLVKRIVQRFDAEPAGRTRA